MSNSVPCPDCFTGTLRGDAVPTGTVEEIHGLKTYVARPERAEPKGLLVIIPDAFGWELKNSRALADDYARRAQLLVYLPDFMNGASVSVAVLSASNNSTSNSWTETLLWKPYRALQMIFSGLPWLFWTRQSVTKPRLTKFFQDLRSHPPPFSTERLKIGVAGFCWGGYYTVYLARDEEGTRVPTPGLDETLPLVDCAFTAHPSFLTVPRDVEHVKQPLSVANGPDDLMLGRKSNLIMKEILESKEDSDHEVIFYDGARHGFAVRGDPNDPRQLDFGRKAEDQAVKWFRRYLS